MVYVQMLAFIKNSCYNNNVYIRAFYRGYRGQDMHKQ